jgi:hypothetical protein
MKKTYLILVAFTALASCKKDVEPTPSYTGQVQLVDEFGTSQANNSDVLVTVTDVSPQVTTHSAADGTFHLSGVPDGSHLLSYSKDGYGTFKQGGVIADSKWPIKLDAVTLGQVSTTLVTLNSTVQLPDGVVISGTISPLPTAAKPRPHRLFLQKYDSYTPSGPIVNNYTASLLRRTRADGTFTDTLSYYDLGQVGIRSTFVAVRVTGDNPTAATYPDLVNGRLQFPAANLDANPKGGTFYAYN